MPTRFGNLIILRAELAIRTLAAGALLGEGSPL